MKKLFVLMIALGAIATANAQSRRDVGVNDRDVSFNDKRPGNDTRYETSNEWRRKEAIESINREYDYKIASVKRSRYLKAREKNRQIQMLERERAQKIRIAFERFPDRKNSRYDDWNGKRF